MADLTTLAAVKDAIPLTDTASDARLTRLISACSAAFLNQIDRGALLTSTYTERRNGNGGTTVLTKYYPIQQVSTVLVDGRAIAPSPDSVQPGYVFDEFSISLIGHTFRRGKSNVSLSYTAGYDSAPADVENAVIDMVLFEFRRLPVLGSISSSMNGVVTTSYSQKDLPPGVELVMDNYRNRTVLL